MPTAYTARLYDGDQDFRDFVRNTARGMGAFVYLRESSWDTPLTYPEDGTRTEKSNSEEDNSEFFARRDRFDNMIAQVTATRVPKELQTFKDFMLQQLGTEFEGRREPYTHAVLSYPEWCERQAEYRQRIEDYRREDFRRERKNYWERCDYIDMLGETYGIEVKDA